MSLKRWFRFTRNVIHHCGTIFLANYPYSKSVLLRDYLELVIKAIFEGFRTKNAKKNWKSVSAHRVLSYRVITSNSHSLLSLFEEIFIQQIYRFESKHNKPVIIDCGSNIGLSILYFKTVFPDSSIMGFEPHKETFMLLRENLQNNGLSNVHVFNVALGHAPGTSVLFADPARSLNMTFKPESQASHYEESKVVMEVLSAYIDQDIDLVKIDVEGSEEDIVWDLISAGKMNSIHNIILEYHDGRPQTTLECFIKLIEDQKFRLCQRKIANVNGDAIIRFNRAPDA